MMLFPDVNVLVAAHRSDHPGHAAALALLDGAGGSGFALCAHTWNGFLRLVTHPTVFKRPTRMAIALATVAEWRQRPDSRVLQDTPRSWQVFDKLCVDLGAEANGVYDLHLAALAISHRCRLVSSDQDFARVPGLEWSTSA